MLTIKSPRGTEGITSCLLLLMWHIWDETDIHHLISWNGKNKEDFLKCQTSFWAVSDSLQEPVTTPLMVLNTDADSLASSSFLTSHEAESTFLPRNKRTGCLRPLIVVETVKHEAARQTARPPSGRVITGFPATFLLIKAERASSNEYKDKTQKWGRFSAASRAQGRPRADL